MPIVVPTITPTPPTPGTVPMVDLSEFYPLITYTALGAPEPLIDQLLVMTAIKFCRDTDCVQIIQPAIDVVAGANTYAIAPPVDMQLNRVLKAWYRNRQLTATSPDLVDDVLAYRSPVDGIEAQSGEPTVYYQETPTESTIGVYPVPNENVAGGLIVRVSFKPEFGATQLPELLLNEWGQEFCAGVRGALHAMPNQTFTDSARAEMEFAQYASGMRTATMQINTGAVRTGLRVRNNPLF